MVPKNCRFASMDQLKRIFGRWTSRVRRMHSVFSAQTRRFGHSHSFDSQVGNTYVSLALGNGDVVAAASIRSEESICQTRRFAPTVGQSMSVTGISRQAQRNCSMDKVPFCLRKVRAIIAREYSRSKTPRSLPRRQAIHDLALKLRTGDGLP
jgi:hypothetical protein